MTVEEQVRESLARQAAETRETARREVREAVRLLNEAGDALLYTHPVDAPALLTKAIEKIKRAQYATAQTIAASQ